MYKIWLLSVTSLSLLILFQTPGLPGALLMAIIGFYFLYPLTQWLWHKTGSWKLSVWISYIGGGVFLATLLGFLGVEVREQVQEFKTLLPQLQMTVTHTIETLNHRDWSGLGIDSESINKAGQSLAQWLLGLAPVSYTHL
ncbi:MAG: hypothetical protein N2Z70_07455, partial [Bdellovibrionaceae bacterium]|nr:hypothetical protein [Pseudobdellovibrionaceae bacterium]